MFTRTPAKADYYFNVTYASTTNMQVSTVGRGLLVKNAFIPKLTNEKIIGD